MVGTTSSYSQLFKGPDSLSTTSALMAFETNEKFGSVAVAAALAADHTTHSLSFIP